MNILGLHIGHDAAAALIVNGRLTAMVERERLTRVKHDRAFLPALIDNVCHIGGIHWKNVDYVAVSIASGSSESPKIKPSDRWGISIRKNGEHYHSGPRQLNPWDCEDGLQVRFDGITKPGFQVQHHVAHAASAFYVSPFDEAIALTYDGSGLPDDQTSLICLCKDNKIEVKYVPHLNSSLFYGQISKYMLGSWYDAGKLMGLAAYGEPSLYKKTFLNDPTIEGALACLRKNWPSPALLKATYESSWNQDLVKDVAASMQRWMEDDVVRVLDFIEETYGDVNLITAGGGALNVLCNRIIFDRFPMFTPPFVQDSGLATGGALYVLHSIFDQPRQDYTTADLAFLGNGYGTETCNIPLIAQLLANNNVVFWHQGRSEVGPRALTHRSIFANASIAEMKKRVSEDIKGREEYRPLAPIVLEEDCSEYFDVVPNPMTDFMLLNARVLKPDLIPAVTHVDGTARVQTVSEEFNPVVYNLLQEYKKLTGIPVLINTSLNIQGQAICETPRDTEWTFDNCDAEVCAIDDRILASDFVIEMTNGKLDATFYSVR